MAKNIDIKEICTMLTVFIDELRKQASSIRAYIIVFDRSECNNIFIQRAHDSIWREMLAELARIFDKSRTCGDANCTLTTLREICLEGQNVQFFPNGANNDLMRNLDALIEQYNKSVIKKSRNKQLAHHDLHSILGGKPIEISFDELELLICNTTRVFEKIYACVFSGIEISFPPYDMLVKCYESSLYELFRQMQRSEHNGSAKK